FPFGVEITDQSPADGPLRFTGHERDADILAAPSGALDYMHARYYSAFAGRFSSLDPVLDVKRSTREPQSWNRYSYVINNPINRIDPDGRMDGNGMGEPAEWTCPGCTRAEQLDQSNQIAKGTAIVAAVELAIMAGPSGWRALGAAGMNWIRGNPGAVQNITNAVEALASPAGPSASPGLPQIAKQLATAERIGAALKADPTHRAASMGLDAVAQAGQSFSLKGGDGVTRTLVQAPGGMNGKAGIFEYIINKAGQVTHQRFIEGGVITGVPNQKPRV
ncbi:MAG TPA: RHS repeat-associated core domain-containing protein, partial [Thermoanaerobaculia bacterium]|nr:RHS repeat-associated core domain-containing protein [Thermoanaerobaculia bacterium]